MAHKPTFIFFKMPWCGHCVTFDEGRPAAGKQPQWKLMETDQELKKIVDLKKIVWNTRPDSPPIIPIPEEYRFVNYGPYFWLEAGRDQNGKPQGVTYRGTVEITAEVLKKWIIETVSTHELFVNAQKPQRQVVAAVNQQPSPKPAVLNAAPSAASKQQRAPVDERLKTLGANIGVKQPAKPVTKQATIQQVTTKQIKTQQIVREEELEEDETPVRAQKKEESSFSYRRPGTHTRLAVKMPTSLEGADI